MPRHALPKAPPEDQAKRVLHMLSSVRETSPEYAHFREQLHETIADALATTMTDSARDDSLPFILQLLAACEVSSSVLINTVTSVAFAASHLVGADEFLGNDSSSADLFRLALADFLCEGLTRDMRKRVNAGLLDLNQARRGEEISP